MGLDPANNEFHIDICDLFMLVVCLEDQESGSSPAVLRRSLQSGGHQCTLGDEFQQVVQGEVLHAECLS